MLDFIRFSLVRFRPHWKPLCLIVITLLLQTAFKVGLPLGYSEIFDGAIANDDRRYLAILLLLLCGAWVINLLASLAQDRATAHTGAEVINGIRSMLYQQLQQLPLSYFRKRNSGDLASLFSSDIAAIELVYLRSLYTVVYSAIVLLLSVGLLFLIEWRLALLTFASLPIALLGPKLIGSKAQRLNYERKNEEAAVNATVTETIGTSAEIRVFGLQGTKHTHFHQQLSVLSTRLKRAFITAALVGRTSSQTIQLVQILIMGLGGYLAISGQMTVGSVVGFAALLMNVSNAANHLAAAMPEILPASAAYQRISEFLKETVNQLPNNATRSWPEFSEIRFERVSLSYTDSEQTVLKDLTFHIPAGQSIAIVGSSGSGKSSILNLILRLYQPDSGTITFGQVDLNTINEAALRQHCSVVMQHTLLFNCSFRDNISMQHPEADDAAVVQAAEAAEIHDFINSLPDGYDTSVGEWGDNLSGGQRQRIAIARAMLRNPELLILDEATSALDPATERAINETLNHFKQGRTVISTTHRLSSARNADLILVMLAGQLVEQGTHNELLQKSGVYAALWEKQSGFDLQPDGAVDVSTKRLAALPLLNNLSEERLQTIQDSALFTAETFPAQHTLFTAGDTGSKFYLIVHGKVEVTWVDSNSGQEHFQALEDGDYFGEMALLEDAPRNATVRTTADSVMLSLGRREFNTLLDDEPSLRATIETEVRSRIEGRKRSQPRDQ